MGDVSKQIRRVAVALAAGVAGLGGLVATAGRLRPTSAAWARSNGTPTTVLAGRHGPGGGRVDAHPAHLPGGGGQVRVRGESQRGDGGHARLPARQRHRVGGPPTVNDHQTVGLLGGAEPTFVTNVSIETGTESDCTSQNVTNVLTITVVNPGSPGLLGPSVWTVPVTGITYNIGLGATTGQSPSPIRATRTATRVHHPGTGLVPSNATVTDVAVSSNNPPVGLVGGADTDAAISPIALTESVTGTLKHGLHLRHPYQRQQLRRGDPGANHRRHRRRGRGQRHREPSRASDAGLRRHDRVEHGSGRLHVGQPVRGRWDNLGPATFTLSTGSASACAGGVTLDSAGDRAFAVYAESRTAGSDADATAALEMESVFPPPPLPGYGRCPHRRPGYRRELP